MTKETAHALRDAANYARTDLGVRPDYSGRCMYGETTFAVVVGSERDLRLLVGNAVRILTVEGPGPDAVDRFLDDVAKFRTDGMGRDIVVY